MVSSLNQRTTLIQRLDLRQEGTEDDDFFFGVTETLDGNVVATGYTLGNWSVTNDGWNDVAAVKLNVDNGEVIWNYQVGLFTGRYFEEVTRFIQRYIEPRLSAETCN